MLLNQVLFVSVVSALTLSSSAFAAPVSTSPAPTRIERSSKKAAAEHTNLAAPQVLEVGDNLIGVRASQGTAFEGTSVLGFNFENMIAPNFGLGAQLHYANYTNRFNGGGVSGEYNYTALALAATGNMHVDLFKVKNLDTFGTLALARTFLTSRWKSNQDFANPSSADSGTFFLAAYLNARYFVDSKLAVTASVGTGLGTLGFGLDYLF